MDSNIVNALVELARLHVRMGSNATDSELAALVRASVEDMQQKGVDTEALLAFAELEKNNPLAVRCVMLYCKGHYGMAGSDSEAERYIKHYENISNKMALFTELKAGD